jgi:hypothetical protein
MENRKFPEPGTCRQKLTVAEEFGDVEYRRVFSVPQFIDVGKVNAELKDGVFKLHLPKTEAAKPKTIMIVSRFFILEQTSRRTIDNPASLTGSDQSGSRVRNQKIECQFSGNWFMIHLFSDTQAPYRIRPETGLE